jgi:hypothetical protein
MIAPFQKDKYDRYLYPKGVTPPFVKNCTLSREPGINTAPELLWRGFRDSLDQIEDLSSVSPVNPDLRPNRVKKEVIRLNRTSQLLFFRKGLRLCIGVAAQ